MFPQFHTPRNTDSAHTIHGLSLNSRSGIIVKLSTDDIDLHFRTRLHLMKKGFKIYGALLTRFHKLETYTKFDRIPTNIYNLSRKTLGNPPDKAMIENHARTVIGERMNILVQEINSSNTNNLIKPLGQPQEECVKWMNEYCHQHNTHGWPDHQSLSLELLAFDKTYILEHFQKRCTEDQTALLKGSEKMMQTVDRDVKKLKSFLAKRIDVTIDQTMDT